MPGRPSARLGDNHICPATSPAPHVGGPIVGPCAPSVLVANRPMARGTDSATCTGPPDFIVTGAATVKAMHLPAARLADHMAHGGAIGPSCCPNVLIGGTTTGVTLGAPAAGTSACELARQGRATGNYPAGDVNAGQPIRVHENEGGQSYNNCGIESARQIINQANRGRPPIGEEALMNESLAAGRAERMPNDRFGSGGTYPDGRQQIMAAHGVASHQTAPTAGNLDQAVSERRGVIANVWAARLWEPSDLGTMVPGTATGGHSILVTGVNYDANGNVESYTVNDTGIGTCGQTVPAARLRGAFMGRGQEHNVTDRPIW